MCRIDGIVNSRGLLPDGFRHFGQRIADYTKEPGRGPRPIRAIEVTKPSGKEDETH